MSGPREQFTASAAKVWWGGTGFLADLGEDLISLNLNGQTTVARLARRTATGRLGHTADGLACGWQVSISARRSDATRKLITNREGILVISRSDSGRALAIPMIVQQINAPSDRAGASTLTATLTQRNVGLPVEGPRVTGAGNRPVAQGQELYVVRAAAIERKTAAYAQLATDLVSVVGVGQIGEAAR